MTVVKSAVRWLEKRARGLLWLGLALFALWVLGMAARGDFGAAVTLLAALVFGALIGVALFAGGILLGVAMLDRLRQDRPVVGALPDVAQAATASAKILRGESSEEPLPPPVVPDAEDDDEAAHAGLTADAQVQKAAEMLEHLLGKKEEDAGG